MSDENERTVLLVDDEPLILDVCSAVLRNAGFRVLCSPSGKSGLEAFRAHKDELALVISDIVMPKLSGPDMTREMLAERPDLKVVYMSGYGAATTLPGGSEGTVHLISKPFTAEQFLQMVRASLASPVKGLAQPST